MFMRILRFEIYGKQLLMSHYKTFKLEIARKVAALLGSYLTFQVWGVVREVNAEASEEGEKENSF